MVRKISLCGRYASLLNELFEGKEKKGYGIYGMDKRNTDIIVDVLMISAL